MDLQRAVRRNAKVPHSTVPQISMAGRFILHVMGIFWKI